MQLALLYTPGLRSYPPRAQLVTLRLTNTSTCWQSTSLAFGARPARLPARRPLQFGQTNQTRSLLALLCSYRLDLPLAIILCVRGRYLPRRRRLAIKRPSNASLPPTFLLHHADESSQDGRRRIRWHGGMGW